MPTRRRCASITRRLAPSGGGNGLPSCVLTYTRTVRLYGGVNVGGMTVTPLWLAPGWMTTWAAAGLAWMAALANIRAPRASRLTPTS
jgi:hypothetical protein